MYWYNVVLLWYWYNINGRVELRGKLGDQRRRQSNSSTEYHRADKNGNGYGNGNGTASSAGKSLAIAARTVGLELMDVLGHST